VNSGAAASSSSSSSASVPAEENEVEMDDQDDNGENDQPAPEEMDPLLDNVNNDDESGDEIGDEDEGWVEIAIPNARRMRGVDQFASTLPPTNGPSIANARNIPPGSTSVLHFFQLLFNATILAMIVTSTNIYGNAHVSKQVWQDVNTVEINKFIGIVLYMGILRQPDFKSYWSRDEKYHRSWVSKRMSRNRFQQIWSALHFVDVTENGVEMTRQQRSAKNVQDGFWMVRPFVETLATHLIQLDARRQ
jgi:hypothetical protein